MSAWRVVRREKSIKAFAEGVSSGSLTPEYKSAPEPEEPTDGGVAVVVGKNFDTIVKDDGKDVLLEVWGAQRPEADVCMNRKI